MEKEERKINIFYKYLVSFVKILNKAKPLKVSIFTDNLNSFSPVNKLLHFFLP